MRTKITKEEYLNLDNGIVQNITREFIHSHIFRNQSSLISHLQENFVEGFNSEDVENEYLTEEEIIKYHLDEIELDDDSNEITSDMLDDFRYDNPKEIFEWYLVSDWFLDRLREINEPIIDNDYGEYWGRCCTGQSIYLDYNMQELAFEYASDERLYKKKVA